ncbi:glycine oxidase ThiO [Corynebacterium guangdongense]|uniref:glycine oxidase n=1 Tax=Corynebacterium guangdongense TaxID=1783348 RepID=A0ABU1ZXW5_9CORY|nr:glycine oxidase ThiO [Corynebacterium guangdongense]MDR7329615.1 glycine oxidase [Corynebacterium guangdongense]WJZ18180.1 Hydrogen cyanide synthase subunit HcnC precursor [Corynebacterium guangdongense]
MRVTVIGAGVIGLATAFELMERGDQVRLLDPDPAGGSSHHAGGMLAPSAEVQYRQEPLFPLMVDSARAYPALLQRLAARTDLPTGYRTEGTLVVAHDRADAEHLAELMAYQHVQGMAVERLSVREARGMEPALAPRLAGAVSIPGDHQVNPRLLCAALLDALSSGGAEIVRDAVTRIEGARVIGARGSYDADQVVLAAGLGAARIDGWYRGENPLRLRPVYGDILRLGVPEYLRPLVGRVIRGFVEDRPVYLIPRSDGTIALGATSREDDRPQPRLGGAYDLIRDAVALVPGVEETTLLEITAGARPGTPDDLPYLGRVSEGLVVSTGYFRHGILLAALGARDGARLVHGEDPGTDLSAAAPLRHQ